MLLESIPLKKLITGVDVTFCNSLIEDYNNRPHWTLWGLTPNQVHAGMPSWIESGISSLIHTRAGNFQRRILAFRPALM